MHLGGHSFFADLAGDTAHALLPIAAVIDEEWKAARGLDVRQALLRELHRGETVFFDVAAEEVARGLGKPAEDAFTQHECHLRDEGSSVHLA